MSDYQVGDYAIFKGREIKIINVRIGVRSEKAVYHVEWNDRYEGYKEEYAVEGELSPVPTNRFTDCGPEPSVTIDLIHSIMTIAHVIRDRDLEPQDVQNALKDLFSNSDVSWLIDQARNSVQS